MLLGVITKATATFSAEKPAGGVGQTEARAGGKIEITDAEESAMAEPIAETPAQKEQQTPDLKLTFIIAGREIKDQEQLDKQATQIYEDNDKEHFMWTRFELDLSEL